MTARSIAVGDNINDADMLRVFEFYAMEDSVAARQGLASHTVASVTRLIERELDTNYTVDCYGTTGK
jgi:hydroxymethylpyrimidine pyrophosphatase-like HAD family hydrolase